MENDFYIDFIPRAYFDITWTISMGVCVEEGVSQDSLVCLMTLALLIAYALLFSSIGNELLAKGDEVSQTSLPRNQHVDYLDRIGFSQDVPVSFLCPITQQIMVEPVRIEGGHQDHVFERVAIEKWIAQGSGTHPLTREPIGSSSLIVPAYDVADEVQKWMNELRVRRSVFYIWSAGKLPVKVSLDESVNQFDLAQFSSAI